MWRRYAKMIEDVKMYSFGAKFTTPSRLKRPIMENMYSHDILVWKLRDAHPK